MLLAYVVVRIAPDPRQATPYFTAITMVAVLALVLGFASVLLVAMYWVIRRILRSASSDQRSRSAPPSSDAPPPPDPGARRAERL